MLVGVGFLIETCEEVICDEGNIGAALAQWWQVNIDHIEPVVEVFTEAATLDLCGEVSIGRRKDPNIDLDRLLATHTADHTFLNHS